MLRRHRVTAAHTAGDRIQALSLQCLQTGAASMLQADLFVDATEIGDLLALAGVEHVFGAESQAQPGELHALPEADPFDQQAITWCLACEHRPGEDHTIPRPPGYERLRTLAEQHIGVAARPGQDAAEAFADSVGIGAYRIDLHPSTRFRNTVDIDSYPFQIPLGALLPVRVDNLLPACKNIGSTRITNGACREHATEWSIGEAVGLLAASALAQGLPPRAIRADAGRLADFQRLLQRQGVLLAWPRFGAMTPTMRTGYTHDRR